MSGNTPEGRVKARIKYWIKKIWAKALIYMPVQMGFGKHGAPDFICCVPIVIDQSHVGKTFGLFVGIEAKAAGRNPTQRQLEFLREIEEAGGMAMVLKGVQSVNDYFEQFEQQ